MLNNLDRFINKLIGEHLLLLIDDLNTLYQLRYWDF